MKTLKRLLDRLSEYLKKTHAERKHKEFMSLRICHYNTHPWTAEEHIDQGDQGENSPH